MNVCDCISHLPLAHAPHVGHRLIHGIEWPSRLWRYLWSVADLLRGDYKQSEHGKVILPSTVLRRLDCVLGHTDKIITMIGGFTK